MKKSSQYCELYWLLIDPIYFKLYQIASSQVSFVTVKRAIVRMFSELVVKLLLNERFKWTEDGFCLQTWMSVRHPSVRATRSVLTPSGPTRAPAGPDTQHGPRVGSVSVRICLTQVLHVFCVARLFTSHSLHHIIRIRENFKMAVIKKFRVFLL